MSEHHSPAAFTGDDTSAPQHFEGEQPGHGQGDGSAGSSSLAAPPPATQDALIDNDTINRMLNEINTLRDVNAHLRWAAGREDF